MDYGFYSPNFDGEGLRIGIVQARFNEPVCEALRDACLQELERLGIESEDTLLVTVPGAKTFVSLDQPEAVATAISTWVAAHPLTGAR